MECDLPYIDLMLNFFEKVSQDVGNEVFHHIHWGFWEEPGDAKISFADYKIAGDQLSKRIFDTAGTRDGQKILDAGCGFGGSINLLVEKYENLEVFGVNIDNRQIAKAKESIVRDYARNNSVKFISSDACDIPLENEKFDNIFSIESIFHFRSRDCFFKECERLMKKDGVLVISDFTVTMVGLFLLAFPYLGVRYDLNKVYGKHLIPETIGGYRRLGKKYGLELERVENVTLNTFPIYAYLRVVLKEIGAIREFAKKSNLFLEYASKMGFLKYEILKFKKA